MIEQVRKRDGTVVPFETAKIASAIHRALGEVGRDDLDLANALAIQVEQTLSGRFGPLFGPPHVEEIQDVVEEVLMAAGLPDAARAYIVYRHQHKQLREIKELVDPGLVGSYLNGQDWRVRENSNMAFSLQGLNVFLTEKIIGRYWLTKVYPEHIRTAHVEGDFHIHDLGTLGPYTYYGQEVVVARQTGQLKVCSFEQLYAGEVGEEVLLCEADGAYAKFPSDLHVLDKDGWTRVTRLVRKAKHRPMRFIKNRGGRSVIVTDNHPMIVPDGEKEAGALGEGDRTFTVSVARLLADQDLFSQDELDLAEAIRELGFGGRAVYLDGAPLAEAEDGDLLHTATCSIPRFVRLTEGFGYFVGLTLAEGFLSYDATGARVITITQQEREPLLRANRGLLDNRTSGCLRLRDDGRWELRVTNPFLRFLFEQVFEIRPGSRHKALPVGILSYSRSFGHGLIAGLLDGDGTVESCGTRLSLRIAARTLLEQLAVVMELLGFVPRDRAIEGQGSRRWAQGREIVQNYPLYGLSFSKTEREIPGEKYQAAAVATKSWHDADRDQWHRVIVNDPVDIPDDVIYDITTESRTLVVNGMWNHNCVGWDLADVLRLGFRGARGKVESHAPKHFRVALMQAVNFLYTLQGEAAGAQAFSSVDTLLAPFIAADRLSYPEVKQALQEFAHNLNVPTRVGFQCLSEDTEILTPAGWKGHDEVREGDLIYTFNLERREIEPKRIAGIFSRHYAGPMYNLKNRSQDQLISPGHRVVRQAFNRDAYVLQPIEEILSLQSPIAIPVRAPNANPDYPVPDEQLQLLAWVLSEGSVEGEGSYRVSINQSPAAHREEYEEIVGLLDEQGLDYTTYPQKSLGTCTRIRLRPAASRVIHGWLGGREKRVPDYLAQLSQRQARLFLDTYVKGDGWVEEHRKRITVTDKRILAALEAVAVLAGYNFSVRERTISGISTKEQYILSLTEADHDYIQEITPVDYEGIIWSVHTENETVIAKRRGQVFITGNTPFTNITLDLHPPAHMAGLPALVGGKEFGTYAEFGREMGMFNRALAEVMAEGDARGRVFTFPIPTYNITPDFPWDNPDLLPLWEMTAKYGIPYFANFIASEMRPEDARSMCCRLRLDVRELRRRGGGLFGSNPLTGSVGVVTVNLPRLAHLARSEDEFFDRLRERMQLAGKSLIIKRKVLERLTGQGLYPYSKFYLSSVKGLRGEYWGQHFSTIGVIGMNEAALNLHGASLAEEEGIAFARRTLEFMREILVHFQEASGHLWNLEATPAEGTSYRLARLDVERHPRIRVANEAQRQRGAAPYYTNSSQLPVDFTDDLFQALTLQEGLQTQYTGGTVFHAWLGERLPSPESVKSLVAKVLTNFRVPYLTLTPTFSVCPKHGYLPGERRYCPECDEELVVRYQESKGGVCVHVP
jgi:ribonucleoside-triphosphate reductase